MNIDYRHRLDEVYQKYYGKAGCHCQDECHGAEEWSHGCRFYKAKLGAHYGEQYPGQVNPIRLMFVGKESTDEGCLLSSDIGETSSVLGVPNNNYHYFGTIYTAVRVLTSDMPDSPNRLDLQKYNAIHHYFCLTNYFKCSFKNTIRNSWVKANRAMKKNCPGVLLSEIDALRPNILIIQGKFTGSTFWKGLEKKSMLMPQEVYESGKGISATEYHYSDGTPFYVIWSYHPCAPGRLWYHSLEYLEEAISCIKMKLY